VVTRGSKTVRINGLPAVRQGDNVIEACGGSDPIAAGCANVQIGDLPASGAAATDPGSAESTAAAADEAAQAVIDSTPHGAVPAESAAPAAAVGPLLPPARANVAATWIGIILRDFDDAPMPNQDFTVTLRGGQVLSGRTDQRGYMRFDGVQPGAGDVTFVRIPDAEPLTKDSPRGSDA
jgi:hypothetical protein